MAEMFNPLNPEILELSRQRRMADLLTTQGMQTPQGQTVAGGIYVPPNPMEYIAKLYGTYQGTKANRELDTKEVALAKALRQQQVDQINQFRNIQQGTPAVEGGIYGADNKLTMQTTPDMFGPNMELNPQYRQVAPVAAVAGNPQAANLFAASSTVPALQALGLKKLTEGPKWKEVTEFNQKTGNTETYRYDENSPNPRDTLQFIAINKPAISPEAQIRFSDEGIGIPQQFRGGGISVGQPTMQPQIQPMGQNPVQPFNQPVNQPVSQPLGQPTPVAVEPVTAPQGYNYFKPPSVPAGLSGKQAREFISEQNKPLTGKPAEQVTGAINYQKSLDKVQNLLDTYKGPQLLDPNVRAQFKAAIRTAQLQGKEAFGLGVLNGPDLDILEQVISDPTAFDAFLKDRGTINKLYNNQREFTSEAIKTNYRAAQKAVPNNLREYVEIKPKELTPDSKGGGQKGAIQIQRATLNGEPIEVRNKKWVYSKTGKAVE
jgi:hypothetical protein